MKLYYSPGACSLSPHIVAREAGLPVELSRVTFSGAVRTTAEGEDFFQVNDRGGYVPALRLDDGTVLVEGPAIIQYLSDQAPDRKLVPEKGSDDFYTMLSWVSFVGTELHKGFSPLFRHDLPEDEKERVIEKLHKRFAVLEKAYEGKEYLMGSFTIADAYAYTIIRWFPRAGFSLSDFPNLSKLVKAMQSRDGVKTALLEEGLDAMA